MEKAKEQDRTALHELRRYWHNLLLALLMYVCTAASSSFAGTLTQAAVQAEFGASVGEVSAVIAGIQFLRGLCLLLASPVIDHVGAIATVRIALGALGGLCLLMGSALVSSINRYYLVRMAIGVLSPFSDQPACICLASGYFSHAQPFAIATINAGYSIAGAIIPVALAALVTTYGWRLAWTVVGVAIALVVLSAVVLLRPGPLAVGSATQAASPTSGQVVDGVLVPEAAREPAFWAMLTSAFCILYYEGFITNHLLLALHLDAGLTLSKASIFYSLQYGFAIAGKLSAGALVMVAPRRLLFILAPVAFSASHLWLLEAVPAGEPPPGAHVAPALPLPAWLSVVLGTVGLRVTRNLSRLGAFAVFYGLSFGLTHSLNAMQPAHLFGRVHLPYLQTAIFVVYVVAASTTQLVSGYMYDAARSYAAPLLLTFAVSGLNVPAMLVLGMAPAVEDRAARAAKMHPLV